MSNRAGLPLPQSIPLLASCLPVLQGRFTDLRVVIALLCYVIYLSYVLLVSMRRCKDQRLVLCSRRTDLSSVCRAQTRTVQGDIGSPIGAAESLLFVLGPPAEMGYPWAFRLLKGAVSPLLLQSVSFQGRWASSVRPAAGSFLKVLCVIV